MPYQPKQNFGRPPLDETKVREVQAFAERGEPPTVAIEKTGVGKTKVYDIYRMVREKAGGC